MEKKNHANWWIKPTRIEPEESLQEMVLSLDLQKTLLCFICTEPVKCPIMCLSCSQFGCFECLSKWVEEKKTCPHCRMKKSVTDFIKVPIIAQILDKVKLAEQYACERHDTQSKDLFCMECDDFFCHECILFDGNHANHTLRKRSEINQEQMAKIDAFLAKARQEIANRGKRIAECHDELESLKQQQVEFKNFIIQLEQAFGEELNFRNAELNAEITRCREEVESLSRQCNEVKKNRNISKNEIPAIQPINLSFESAISILQCFGIQREENFTFQLAFPYCEKFSFQLTNGSKWILSVEQSEIEGKFHIGVFCIMEHSPRLRKERYFVCLKIEGQEKRFVKDYEAGHAFGFKKFSIVPKNCTVTNAVISLEARIRGLGINN